MNDAKLAQLISLLDQLDDRLKASNDPAKPEQFDQLAILCLKIAACVSENIRLLRIIATRLSIIFDAFGSDSPAENLVLGFSYIENNLEEDLRGFSRLLEQVLEENDIKINSGFVLDKLAPKHRPWSLAISDFVARLDRWQDLRTVFDTPNEQALLLLFAEFIFSIIKTKYSYSNKQKIIFNTVLDKCLVLCDIKDKKFLLKNINLSDQESVVNYVVSQAASCDLYNKIFSQALMMAFLCIIAAKDGVLSEQNLEQLDMALSLTGFEGLEPLLDAGFLRLSDLATRQEADDLAKILQVF